MIRKLLRDLGPTRSSFLITMVSILASVLIYTAVGLLTGQFLASGIIIAILIPAIVAPVMSHHFQRILIKLDQTERALVKLNDELEEQVNQRVLELEDANMELRTEIAMRTQVETELRDRTRQQTAVAELGQRALANADLPTLMEEAVHLVAHTLGVDYAKILELIPNTDTFLLRAGVGWQEGLVGSARLYANTDSHEAGYTLLSRETVVVTDFRQETRFRPSSLLHDHLVVSSVNVIIPGKERPLGVLGADTTTRRPFSQGDINFLMAIANVLALVMEQKHTKSEIIQRQQELLALQSAGVAITSSLDLQEVLKTVAQTITHWLGVAGCAISEWNQADDTVTTMVDFGTEVWSNQAEEEGRVYQLIDYPLTKQVLVERCPYQMTVNQSHLDPAELAYMKENELTTLLMLPMIFQERVIGLVEVMDDWASRTFTDKEITLGQLLANQAASAIENARLHAETRRQLAEQTALREAIAAISSTLELEIVLSQIAEQMCRAINATSAYICTYDLEKNESGVLAEYIGPDACPEEQVSDKGVVYVEDDPEFLKKMRAGQIDISLRDDPDLSQNDKHHMRQYGAQLILYIPLRIKGQPIGFTELWESRQTREFLPEEITLCQGIAQYAAIAIENARLFEQTQLEITERKRAEEQARTSLKEKEVLLKEIHHRVKNNLQVISSLLSLQSSYIENRQVLSVLDDSQHRVRSMALIHEKLYQSANLAQIDFGDYIRDLAGYLFRAQGGHTRNIGLNIQTDDVHLIIDMAVPCGLILNELISNSLKHAFPTGHSGDIVVTCRAEEGDQIILTVGDNGVGLPAGLDLQNTGTLGLELVRTLTEQLGGTLQLDRTQGIEYRLAFSTHHIKDLIE